MKTSAYFPFDEFMPTPEFPDFEMDAIRVSSVTQPYFPESSPMEDISAE